MRRVVAGCAGKDVAEVVCNGPCVAAAYGDNRQFSQNVLYRDDIESSLLVVTSYTMMSQSASRPTPTILSNNK